MEAAARILKTIHAQESKKVDRERAEAVVNVRSMRLKEAAKKIENRIEETLTYYNVIKRLDREIRRRTRVVKTFPDEHSALMLVCARLHYVTGTQWGSKKYMGMNHLKPAFEDTSSLS